MTEVASRMLFQAGGCVWNPVDRTLAVRGAPVDIPRMAQECLAMLIEANGEVVARDSLLSRFDRTSAAAESGLEHAMDAVRQAIDPAPGGGSHVETIPGVGYRFAVPVSLVLPAPEELDSDARESYLEATEAPSHSGVRFRILPWALLGAVSLLAAVIVAATLYRERIDTEEATQLARTAMDRSRQGTSGAWRDAQQLIDQSLALRPQLPIARSATAELAVRSGEPPFDDALALAKQAVADDPACGDCRAVLGYVLLTRFWNWAEAEQQLYAAATPSAPAATHVWYAQLLAITGRFHAAHREINLAIVKDRRLPGAYVMKGLIFYLQGRFDEAETQLRTATALEPVNPNPEFWTYRAKLVQDHPLQASIAYSRYGARQDSFSGDARMRNRERAYWLSQHGKHALANFWLEDTGADAEARRRQSYERAVWRMWLGDADGALDELERAEKARPFNLIYVAVDPALAPLRSHSRFRALVARLNLPHLD